MLKGSHVTAFPFVHEFSHPDTSMMDTSWSLGLIGRILANDVESATACLKKGTVLTEKDIEALAKEVKEVRVYSGLVAKQSR